MAKKPTTPTPPRRVQAPKQRTSSKDDLGDRGRKILYAVSAAGIVLLAVVVLAIALRGGSSSAAATIRDAGCRYKTFPQQGVAHFTSLTPSPPPKWNSFPPTSGPHYQEPVPLGIYTEALEEVRLVHNLEHGAVVLQYGSKVPPAQVARITEWYQEDPNGIVVAPLPKLGGKVALTSWTQWTECAGFDEKAADAFRSAFRYHGPEKFPKSSLEPGQ